MHKNVHVTQDERMKPDEITFYDHTKGGVDIMDQMARICSTHIKTHWWTTNALAYVLDTTRTNIMTLWNEMHTTEKMSSYDFIWTLAELLIKPHIQYR